MKVLKDSHPTEQALQAVEDVMNEQGISISFQCGHIFVKHQGKTYRVVNIEGMSLGGSLPRWVAEERLVVDE